MGKLKNFTKKKDTKIYMDACNKHRMSYEINVM